MGNIKRMLDNLNMSEAELKSPLMYELEMIDYILGDYGISENEWYEYLESVYVEFKSVKSHEVVRNRKKY